MEGKKARWLGVGVPALTLMTAILVSGQSAAMAHGRSTAPALETCGSIYGVYVEKAGKDANDKFIRGEDGYTYHHQIGLIGNHSFSGLQNGDRVRFDYGKNTYGGGGPTNICKG